MKKSCLQFIEKLLVILIGDTDEILEENLNTRLEKIFKPVYKYGFVSASFEYKHEIIKKIIWQLKFRGNLEIIDYFRPFWQINFDLIIKNNQNSKIFLIPIPLHKKRLKERGFNQSMILAQKIQMDFKNQIQILENFLIRKKYNPKQSRQNKIDRLKNVENIFAIQNPEKIMSWVDNSIKIILIDDVVTTGATLQNAKKCLAEKYPNIEILAYTLAY